MFLTVVFFFFQQFLADPEIISPNSGSQTQSVKLGQSWNITCQARGNPTPTVEWKRKNGNKSMSSREPGSSGVVLTIDSVVEDDLGIYFCVALNSKNVAYAYVELGKIIGHYTIGGSLLTSLFTFLLICIRVYLQKEIC